MRELSEKLFDFLQSGLFDPDFYCKQVTVPLNSSPAVHFILTGDAQGYSPHPLFDPHYFHRQFSSKSPPSAARWFESPSISPHPLFDGDFYCWQLAQKQMALTDQHPLTHYLKQGGFFLNPHPLFDTAFYLAQLPTLREQGTNPLTHFCEVGWRQGYDPNPYFSTRFYLSNNPDVVAEDMNPLVHFVRHGAQEYRQPHPDFDMGFYAKRYSDVVETGMNLLSHYLLYGESEGRIKHPKERDSESTYQGWLLKHDTLSLADRKKLPLHLAALVVKPLISIIMPVYETPKKWLIRAIESVKAQHYSHWELCIADDASKNSEVHEILTAYAEQDPRIKVVFREQNGHISAASNSALALATGEFVGFLDHDDELAPTALFWVAKAINRHPNAALFYSDEDKIDEQGQRSDPYFKCDWNPDLLLSHNLITHFSVYKRTLLTELRGLRLGFEGAQDYDLVLRATEKLSPDQIVHIPKILYHWRTLETSTAKQMSAKNYALQAAIHGISEALERRGVAYSEVAESPIAPNMFRVKYSLPEHLPRVSILIPTRNGLNLLSLCVESLINITHYRNFEIIIIDNGSDDTRTLNYLQKLPEKFPEITFQILRDDRPFNYSQLNNHAATYANGELLLLLNNDIEIIEGDWLGEMVSHAIRPEIGAVGARLLYPDDTLQHAGVIVGLGGLAAHAFRGLPNLHIGYFCRDRLIQDYSAVTAACLLVRKSLFTLVDGLDEIDLTVAYNDVDFCLKLARLGYRNLYTPHAVLYHHESATRGAEDSPKKQRRFAKEQAVMKQRWQTDTILDPAYSPNLSDASELFAFTSPPRLPSEWRL